MERGNLENTIALGRSESMWWITKLKEVRKIDCSITSKDFVTNTSRLVLNPLLSVEPKQLLQEIS